jgi:hypothetical protein
MQVSWSLGKGTVDYFTLATEDRQGATERNHRLNPKGSERLLVFVGRSVGCRFKPSLWYIRVRMVEVLGRVTGVV